jgi:hypothetical protein
MPDDEKLSPADPGDIAGSIAFALLFSGRKRVHDSDTYMAAIVADRIVRCSPLYTLRWAATAHPKTVRDFGVAFAG